MGNYVPMLSRRRGITDTPNASRIRDDVSDRH